MKRYIIIITLFVSIVCVAGCNSDKIDFTDGEKEMLSVFEDLDLSEFTISKVEVLESITSYTPLNVDYQEVAGVNDDCYEVVERMHNLLSNYHFWYMGIIGPERLADVVIELNNGSDQLRILILNTQEYEVTGSIFFIYVTEEDDFKIRYELDSFEEEVARIFELVNLEEVQENLEH